MYTCRIESNAMGHIITSSPETSTRGGGGQHGINVAEVSLTLRTKVLYSTSLFAPRYQILFFVLYRQISVVKSLFLFRNAVNSSYQNYVHVPP